MRWVSKWEQENMPQQFHNVVDWSADVYDVMFESDEEESDG